MRHGQSAPRTQTHIQSLRLPGPVMLLPAHLALAALPFMAVLAAALADATPPVMCLIPCLSTAPAFTAIPIMGFIASGITLPADAAIPIMRFIAGFMAFLTATAAPAVRIADLMTAVAGAGIPIMALIAGFAAFFALAAFPLVIFGAAFQTGALAPLVKLFLAPLTDTGLDIVLFHAANGAGAALQFMVTVSFRAAPFAGAAVPVVNFHFASAAQTAVPGLKIMPGRAAFLADTPRPLMENKTGHALAPSSKTTAHMIRDAGEKLK